MNLDINLINNISIGGHVLIAGPLFSGKSMLMTKLADKYVEKGFDVNLFSATPMEVENDKVNYIYLENEDIILAEIDRINSLIDKRIEMLKKRQKETVYDLDDFDESKIKVIMFNDIQELYGVSYKVESAIKDCKNKLLSQGERCGIIGVFSTIRPSGNIISAGNCQFFGAKFLCGPIDSSTSTLMFESDLSNFIIPEKYVMLKKTTKNYYIFKIEDI